MKAPISLRILLFTLLISSGILPFGCNPPRVVDTFPVTSAELPPKVVPEEDCCPGNSGSPCANLAKELQGLQASGILQHPIDVDSDGCPIVKDQLVVQTLSWCKGPLSERASRSQYLKELWKSKESRAKVMDELRQNLCIRIDSAGFKIDLDIKIGIALQGVCPCDSSLIVLDLTKLSPEEGVAVASIKGGLQGNGLMKLPPALKSGDFEHEDWKCVDDAKRPIVIDHDKKSRKIAIIDSGIDATWLNAVPDHFSSDSYNLLEPESDPIDNYGHGTLVTSIIEKASEDQSYTNKSKNELLVYKAFDDEGVGNIFNVMCALRCAASDEADIINMSWGTYIKSVALEETIEAIAERDNILVASKGNDCLETPTSDISHHPSDYAGVVGVSALDQRMGIASDGGWTYFNQSVNANTPQEVPLWRCSNWDGKDNKISAPGGLGYVVDQDTSDRYGTSFAAAYISGFTAKYFYENGVYPEFEFGANTASSLQAKFIKPSGSSQTIKTWVPR